MGTTNAQHRAHKQEWLIFAKYHGTPHQPGVDYGTAVTFVGTVKARDQMMARLRRSPTVRKVYCRVLHTAEDLANHLESRT